MAIKTKKPNEQLIQLEVCAMNSEGQGVARMEGLTVFVPGAITGDQVEVVIEQRKSNYAVAHMQRLLTPSENRVQPFCAVAAKCGGCTLQPMLYTAQLQMKQEQIIAALTRIGGFAQISEWVRPILGMKTPYAYRSKVQFPVVQVGRRSGFSLPVVMWLLIIANVGSSIRLQMWCERPYGPIVRITISHHMMNRRSKDCCAISLSVSASRLVK
jgi:predicted RNA-binding protein with TRAM domain